MVLKKYFCITVLLLGLVSVILISVQIPGELWSNLAISSQPLSAAAVHSEDIKSVEKSQELEERSRVVTSRINQRTEHSGKTLKQQLLQDMQKCSLSMGVPQEVLKRKQHLLTAISTRATLFLNAFWMVVPKDYLPGLRNPCWYSNITVDKDITKMLLSRLGQYRNSLHKATIQTLHKEIFTQPTTHQHLYCLPYFLIAGFPKCGTTTLHHVLSQHPEITPPIEKESHWWARVPLGDLEYKYLKLATVRYVLEFRPLSKKLTTREPIINNMLSLLTYDGSQSTLIDSNFNIDNEDYCAMAAVLHRVLPNAKILIIMRDPVDRLYSHYYFMHRKFKAKQPRDMRRNAPLYFDKYVRAAINDFKACILNESLYECSNRHYHRRELMTWLGVGIYKVQLEEWLQFWPRENFLFLRTEQLSQDPISVLRSITDFLSISPVSDNEAVKWFSKRENNARYPAMLSKTRRLLEDFYAPYNKQLERFVNSLS